MMIFFTLVLIASCAGAPAPAVVCHSCDATVTELHKSLGSLKHRSETDVFDAIQGICAFKNFRVRGLHGACQHCAASTWPLALSRLPQGCLVKGSFCGMINPESIQACALSLSNAVSRPPRHGALPSTVARLGQPCAPHRRLLSSGTIVPARGGLVSEQLIEGHAFTAVHPSSTGTLPRHCH